MSIRPYDAQYYGGDWEFFQQVLFQAVQISTQQSLLATLISAQSYMDVIHLKYEGAQHSASARMALIADPLVVLS